MFQLKVTLKDFVNAVAKDVKTLKDSVDKLVASEQEVDTKISDAVSGFEAKIDEKINEAKLEGTKEITDRLADVVTKEALAAAEEELRNSDKVGMTEDQVDAKFADALAIDTDLAAAYDAIVNPVAEEDQAQATAPATDSTATTEETPAAGATVTEDQTAPATDSTATTEETPAE